MDILVQPLNRVIRVQPGANLLQALQEAQVPMSYSCMAGRCGTCRCRVLTGENGEAQDEGFVLACQTYLTEPCTVEIAEPDEVVVHPARIVKGTVTAIEALTHDIRRLVIRPAKPIAFSPGQYVQLQFTPEHIRPYSMAGLSGDEVYGLAELDALQREHPALNVQVIVASGGDPAVHRCGLVTDAIEQDHGTLDGWRAYLCGSPPMVEAATVVVRHQGIAAAHIYADAFYSQTT